MFFARILICGISLLLTFEFTIAQKMFRVNPEHTGYYQFKEIDHPKLLWKFKTGDAENRSTPLIHNGNVYVGSNDNCVYSIKLEDGTQNWKFPTGGIVASSPAIAQSQLLFYSNDGYFYSIDATSGSLNWKITIDEETGTKDVWDIFLSSATIFDTLAFIGSDNGKVYCIDILAEDTIWTFQTGDRILATPAVDKEAVYIGSFDGFFYKLDVRTGKEIWKFDAEPAQYSPKGEIQASAVLVDSLVCVGTRGEYMYVLRKSDGTVKWKTRRESSWIVSSAAVDSNVLYFADSDGLKVHAYDINSSEKKWEYSSGSNQFGSIAISDSTVFFSTGKAYSAKNKGELCALNKFTGELKWTFEADDDIWSSPVLHDSIICFGSDDGYMYAITNGEPTSGIEDESSGKVTGSIFSYPNPVSSSTTFEYNIDKNAHIDLRIIDLTGKTVATLFSGKQKPGVHNHYWNALQQSNGIYMYQLTIDHKTITQKLISINK